MRLRVLDSPIVVPGVAEKVLVPEHRNTAPSPWYAQGDPLATLAGVIAALMVLAWMNRFIQDDAFISFRYARNLVEGHGLVWNVGEPVEGYTNFLWVLLLALGMRLGLDPVACAHALGMTCFATTLALTYALVRDLVDSTRAALLGVLVLGTNYTFSAYGTGGLETGLQASLVAGLAVLTTAAMRRATWTRPELGAISLTMTAALLTRLDSALFCIAAGAGCLWSWRRSDRRTVTARALMLAWPVAAVVGAWLSWKLWYYGDILPNTFRLKGTFTSYRRGLWYLHAFASAYLAYPMIAVALASAPRFVHRATPALWMMLAMTAGWLAYVAAVGGDFMEFRFMVPVLPLLVALGAWVLTAVAIPRALRAAILALLSAGSLRHAAAFHYDAFLEIESTAMLQGHLDDPREQWVHIGKRLGALFEGVHDLRIAVTAAGAIPYYSNLPAIDMLGLSDRFVAASGLIVGTRPGHQRIATLSYLLARRVNLVIAHPIVVPIGSAVGATPLLPRSAGEARADPPLIAIPLDGAHAVVAWYLVPNAAVDAAIERDHWTYFRSPQRPEPAR